MSDPKRKNIKEPQEEFIDDGLARLKKEKDPKHGYPKYEKWSMEDLQREAEKKKIPDFMGLNKKDLIKRLKDAKSSKT